MSGGSPKCTTIRVEECNGNVSADTRYALPCAHSCEISEGFLVPNLLSVKCPTKTLA